MCKRILAAQTNTEGGVPFYKIGTIGGKADTYISKDLFDEYKLKYSYPHKGEVMVTCAGTVGKCVIYNGEDSYYQDSNIVWIDNPSEIISNNFLYHLLSRTNWSYLNSTTIVRIYNDDLRNLRLFCPKHDEQKKIAHFLSLLNERIATQNKIIEDLKKLKSAIADKLYSSAKGETYSFRQLFEAVNEKNKKHTYSNILSASQELGMIERCDINIDIKFEQDSISGYKIVRKGDYVVHLRSFQGGFAFSDKTGICSPAYTILRPNDLVAYGYLSHFFTSRPFIKSLKLVTYGIRDGRSINVDEWLDMTVILPTWQEQLHIISVINSIDNKLSNENQIHNCLLRQRTYLLKTMFI